METSASQPARVRHLPGFTCNRIPSFGSCRVTPLPDTGVGSGIFLRTSLPAALGP